MSTSTALVPTYLDAPVRTLNQSTDRCDRCGSEAWVVAIAPDVNPRSGEQSELLFCGHHGAANKDALKDKDWEILDFSEQMRDKYDTSKWLKEVN